MPIPKPKQKETKEHYIARFMKNAIMQDEFKDRKQRLAVAYATWRRKHKDNKRRKK